MSEREAMKIAITGTIGSGKTMVCDYIRSKGFYVFDCDKANSELLKKDNAGYAKIKEAFFDVFDGDCLNKTKLASKVFNNIEEKIKLENIMHPLILEKMEKESLKHDLFFAEVPLLFESNWDKYFDSNLLIVTDKDIALNRLVLRGINKNDAISRINSQLSIDIKSKRAKEIIYNNGSLPELYAMVDEWLSKYVR